MWERGITPLLRLSQGLLSARHHATPTHQALFSQLSLVWEMGIMVLLLRSRGISSECTMPTKQKIFRSLIGGRGHYTAAST